MDIKKNAERTYLRFIDAFLLDGLGLGNGSRGRSRLRSIHTGVRTTVETAQPIVGAVSVRETCQQLVEY